MIDEVDVYFDKDFFGQTYNIMTLFKDKFGHIYNIMKSMFEKLRGFEIKKIKNEISNLEQYK